MFILIVDTQQIVANAKGVPREFLKMKKANNFMRGRPRLSEREWVFVEDIVKITGRLKVDL